MTEKLKPSENKTLQNLIKLCVISATGGQWYSLLRICFLANICLHCSKLAQFKIMLKQLKLMILWQVSKVFLYDFYVDSWTFPALNITDNDILRKVKSH